MLSCTEQELGPCPEQKAAPVPLCNLLPRFAMSPYLLTNSDAACLARKRNCESHPTLTIALALLPMLRGGSGAALPRRELAGSSRKGGSKGKPAFRNAVLGPTKLLWGLVSPAGPGCWLLYPIARTPRAESFGVDAEVSIWGFTSAQILCKEKGLSSLPPAETD